LRLEIKKEYFWVYIKHFFSNKIRLCDITITIALRLGKSKQEVIKPLSTK
jgi:hypothetical protein